MDDGQKGGFCHFSGENHSSALGVSQEDAVRTLKFRDRDKRLAGPVLMGNDLWIKTAWGLDGKSRYAYSIDGRIFTEFGETYQFKWAQYRADRIGLYTFNNKSEDGILDVDFLTYNYDAPAQ